MRNAITKANKHPVETMKYFNYCFTDDGTTLVSYGLEGKHYTMVNKKPTYTDYILKSPKGLDVELARISEGIDWTSLPYAIGWESQFQAFTGPAPWTVKSWEIYREPGMVESPNPTLKYTDAEFAKRNNYITEIDTYMLPMIDKFIMGDESIDKYDSFVAGIKKAGIDDLLKIMNDAYARYQKFGSK
jgi:putative aldouronate transport system substrate-binding protein